MSNPIPQRVLAQQLIHHASSEIDTGLTSEMNSTEILTHMGEHLETIITTILQDHDYLADRTSLTRCTCDVLARYAANIERSSSHSLHTSDQWNLNCPLEATEENVLATFRKLDQSGKVLIARLTQVRLDAQRYREK